MHILVLNGSPKADSKMNEGMIAPYKKMLEQAKKQAKKTSRKRVLKIGKKK